ncbi:MAG: nucleotide exchange factor GrpE [Candidatus Shikimatogenerans sp. Tduv]|uniref:Protein GrpE n=1 Tax=Candidatus Shikimatogenerans sp. Tduv TaxID=3158567 RepID=A0AAU7QT92_9FLAO
MLINKYKKNIFLLKKKYNIYKKKIKKYINKCINKYRNIKKNINIINNKKFNNYIKLLSDYQNQYKRFKKERVDIFNFSNKELILNILPVIDDFERSFNFIKKDKNIFLGINLIYKKLFTILKNFGLKKTKTKVGDKYNLSTHEIIGKKKINKKINKKKNKNIILEIIEQGYYLNNKIIRYDKIIISY